MTDGLTKDGDIYERHPYSGKTFKGFQIPHWDEVLHVAESALKNVDSVNYAGWDLAIRENDVVIIEGNSSPSFGGLQATALLRGLHLKPIYERYLE